MQRYKGYSYVAMSHPKKGQKEPRTTQNPVAISKQTTYLKARFPQLLKHRGQGEHQSPTLDRPTLRSSLWGAPRPCSGGASQYSPQRQRPSWASVLINKD
jgi:hypothetical protein